MIINVEGSLKQTILSHNCLAGIFSDKKISIMANLDFCHYGMMPK